jgi:hypothetical protein
LPAFISIAIAAGLGIHWLIQLAASRRSPIWTPSVAVATTIVLTSLQLCGELAIQQSQALLHCG